jgi:thiol-disulfide isomerase/thioredoxin
MIRHALFWIATAVFFQGCSQPTETDSISGEVVFQLNDSVQATAYIQGTIEGGNFEIGNASESFDFSYDSVSGRINHPFLPSYFTFDSKTSMRGYFHQPERGADYRVPVLVRTKPTPQPIQTKESRTYYLTFGQGDDAYPGILTLNLGEGNRAEGSVRTETGDYRYLYGTHSEDSLKLSAFDGAHLFQFETKWLEDRSALEGRFYSGNHWSTSFEGNTTDTITLRSEAQLATATGDSVRLTLHDLESGDSLQLAEQEGPVVLQLFGSWCPNCYDETRLLKELSQEFPGVQLMGVAFERAAETAVQKQRVNRYVNQLAVPYPVYLGGTASKSAIKQQLTWLSDFISYPTLVFLNEELEIVSIHTGFNGPATGEQYLETVRDIRRGFEKLQSAANPQ